MRLRWLCIRAIVAFLALPAITVYCVWLIQRVATNAFESSRAGQIVRQYESVAPEIERRDKEIGELTRP